MSELFFTAFLLSVALDMILYFGAGQNRFRHTPWIVLPFSGYWLFCKYGFNRPPSVPLAARSANKGKETQQ